MSSKSNLENIKLQYCAYFRIVQDHPEYVLFKKDVQIGVFNLLIRDFYDDDLFFDENEASNFKGESFVKPWIYELDGKKYANYQYTSSNGKCHSGIAIVSMKSCPVSNKI
jgi:hypothetical protein